MTFSISNPINSFFSSKFFNVFVIIISPSLKISSYGSSVGLSLDMFLHLLTMGHLFLPLHMS